MSHLVGLQTAQQPLTTLGQQCSSVFEKRPDEKVVPIFFRTVGDSITIERRPSLFIRFLRFITRQTSQYRFVPCAKALANIFNKDTVATASKDQKAVHDTLLLISAIKQTIRRYEAKRGSVPPPEAVENLKRSIQGFTEEVFENLQRRSTSEEQRILTQWAQERFAGEAKVKEVSRRVAAISEHIFCAPARATDLFSERIETLMPHLTDEERRRVSSLYEEARSTKQWGETPPSASKISESLALFDQNLQVLERTARTRFFNELVAKNQIIIRCTGLNDRLPQEMEDILESEKQKCNRPFLLIDALPSIRERLEQFSEKIRQAEQQKTEALLIQELSLRKRCAALNATNLLEELHSIPPSQRKDLTHIEGILSDVRGKVEQIERERDMEFVSNLERKFQITEHCQDLINKGANIGDLLQRIEELHKERLWGDTKEEAFSAMRQAIGSLNQQLKRAEQEYTRSLLEKVFPQNVDQIKWSVENNLPRMLQGLETTQTTQVQEILPGIFLKVRRRENRAQALISKKVGAGGFKEVVVRAILLGPRLHEDLGGLCAYAKLPGIEGVKSALADIERELRDPATTPRTRDAAEEDKERFLEYLRSDLQDVVDEVNVSQDLPQEVGARMHLVHHEKRPTEIKGILMEWFNKGDLAGYIQKELPQLQGHQRHVIKLQISHKTCDHVARLHEKNLCHLDYKPAQVLVRTRTAGNLTIRISDFGYAQKMNTELPHPKGTPVFTAPEQLAEDRTQQANPAMDNWSLGMSLAELFYGPEINKFRGNKEVHRIQDNWEHARGKTNHDLWCRLCQETMDAIPENIGPGRIIKALLNPNPEQRWTARQAADAFGRLL